MDFDNKAEIDQLYARLSIKADMMYDFVMFYWEYIIEPRDYGTGDKLGMLAVHNLTQIDDNPGITASEIAKFWKRTKGAISQNMKVLEGKGLIRREKDPDNARIVHLYTTEKGAHLALKHKAYDITNIMRVHTGILDQCTMEELDAFYKVLHVYKSLL